MTLSPGRFPYLSGGISTPRNETCDGLDETCNEPAKRKIGGVNLCPRHAAALLADPVFRAARGELAAESAKTMEVAAEASKVDIAIIEAHEAKFTGKGRIRIARGPVVTEPQKPAPVPVAAPTQAAAVVAVESEVEPVREPPKPKEPKPRKERDLLPFEVDPTISPRRCRRIGCKHPDDNVARGLCESDQKVARYRGIYESVALPLPVRPPKPVRDVAPPPPNPILEYVAKNPGCTASECAKALGVPTGSFNTRVTRLRKRGFLAPASDRNDSTGGRLYPVGCVPGVEPKSDKGRIMAHISANPGCTEKQISRELGKNVQSLLMNMRKDGELQPAAHRKSPLHGRFFLPDQAPDPTAFRPLPRKKGNLKPEITPGTLLAAIRTTGAIGATLSDLRLILKSSRERIERGVKSLVEAGKATRHPATGRYLSTTKG